MLPWALRAGSAPAQLRGAEPAVLQEPEHTALPQHSGNEVFPGSKSSLVLRSTVVK